MTNTTPEPVYLPSNEPYLGCPDVLNFDLTISRAMPIHTRIGHSTFGRSLSPVQAAAAELIPQGVSIALSIRELIRQAYLYSAAVLLRPLVERAGTVQYFVVYPESVGDWHGGWPRKKQPEFQRLVELIIPDGSADNHELMKEILHKLVHADPKGAIFNMFERADGTVAYASGKELDQQAKADAISLLAAHCLRRLTTISVWLFEEGPEAA